MSEKIDYKKTYKALYVPGTTPSVVVVPSMRFSIIEGKGDPNGEEFALATEALYSFSYTVKMSYKRPCAPKGYYAYTVFPLEGEWDVCDTDRAVTDKSNYLYRIMIRQPEFLTEELFEQFLCETKKKKPNEWLDRIRFEEIAEGLCCQMLHIGSYDDEPSSFAMMDRFCKANGYKRIARTHREIYLSDPRKTETSKLRTVLRYRIGT